MIYYQINRFHVKIRGSLRFANSSNAASDFMKKTLKSNDFLSHRRVKFREMDVSLGSSIQLVIIISNINILLLIKILMRI